MADGALARFGADLGVGITGIAGPDGGTEEKPVGYVCVCVKVADGPVIARDPVIPGDRAEIRDRSCTLALHLIRRLLRGEDFPLRPGRSPSRSPSTPRSSTTCERGSRGRAGRDSPRASAGSWALISPTCARSARTGSASTTGAGWSGT